MFCCHVYTCQTLELHTVSCPKGGTPVGLKSYPSSSQVLFSLFSVVLGGHSLQVTTGPCGGLKRWGKFFLYYGNLVSEFYENQCVRRPLAPPLDHFLLDALAALPSVAPACRQALVRAIGAARRPQPQILSARGPEYWDHV